MLVAFLQQLLTFGGFYDEQREFLRVERVQVSLQRLFLYRGTNAIFFVVVCSCCYSFTARRAKLCMLL
jgi:hypothetical protein